MTPKLRLDRVRHEFPARSAGRGRRSTGRVTALEDVTLDIRAGEFLVLVGPSGCGKSTLLDLLGGLARPTSGQILLDGVPVTGPGLDRGMVFQQYALLPWRTAQGNVEFGLEALGSVAASAPSSPATTWNWSGSPDSRSATRTSCPAACGSASLSPAASLSTLTCSSWTSRSPRWTPRPANRCRTNCCGSGGDRQDHLFITHSIDEAVYLGQRVAVMTSRPGGSRPCSTSTSTAASQRTRAPTRPSGGTGTPSGRSCAAR